jgi:hypothetical protein
MGFASMGRDYMALDNMGEAHNTAEECSMADKYILRAEPPTLQCASLVLQFPAFGSFVLRSLDATQVRVIPRNLEYLPLLVASFPSMALILGY